MIRKSKICVGIRSQLLAIHGKTLAVQSHHYSASPRNLIKPEQPRGTPRPTQKPLPDQYQSESLGQELPFHDKTLWYWSYAFDTIVLNNFEISGLGHWS
jgi:hypothetical protein